MAKWTKTQQKILDALAEPGAYAYSEWGRGVRLAGGDTIREPTWLAIRNELRIVDRDVVGASGSTYTYVLKGTVAAREQDARDAKAQQQAEIAAQERAKREATPAWQAADYLMGRIGCSTIREVSETYSEDALLAAARALGYKPDNDAATA